MLYEVITVVSFDGKDYLVFHGYDAKDGGRPKLLIRRITWDDRITSYNVCYTKLLRYHNGQHAVKYDISANLSTLKNEVTQLGVSNEPRTDGYCRTEVGREVGSFYGYVADGIFQSQSEIDNNYNDEGGLVTQNGAEAGDIRYKDLDNDGEITNLDQKFLGSGIAKIHYGLNARVEYKGFDLSVSTYGAANFKAVDFVDVTLHSSYGALNKSVDLLNAWTPENINTNVPRIRNNFV